MTSLQTYLTVLITIYLLYLAVTLIRQRRTQEEVTPLKHWLDNRSVGGFFAVLTLFATLFSAGILVGGAGFYYSHGIGTLVFSVGAYLLMGFISWRAGTILWHRSRKNPEVLSPVRLSMLPFSNSVSRVAVGIIYIFLVPYLSLQITGLGKLLLSSVQMPEILTAVLLLLAILIYSELGGVAEVIRTDVVQALATLGGFSAVAIVVAMRLNFRFGDLVEGLENSGGLELLSLPGPTGFYTVANLIALVLVIGTAVITQPQASKRFMVAAELSSVRRMAVVVPILGAFLILLAGLIGFYGYTINPNLASGDLVVGEVLRTIHPFFAAIALFGVIAATMSTSDSLILTFGLLGSEELRSAGGEYFGRRDIRLRTGSVLAIIAAVVAGLASLSPPTLVANLAVLSASGTMQILPVLCLGLMGIRIPNLIAVLSMVSGVAIIVVVQLGYLATPLGLPASVIALIVGTAIAGVGLVWRQRMPD